jgi:hypothetical protein
MPRRKPGLLRGDTDVLAFAGSGRMLDRAVHDRMWRRRFRPGRPCASSAGTDTNSDPQPLANAHSGSNPNPNPNPDSNSNSNSNSNSQLAATRRSQWVAPGSQPARRCAVQEG